MPTFILKVAEYSFKMVKGVRKLQKPSDRDGTLTEKTVEASRVVLGSRPLSDIYVRDRLVPDEALAFEFDGSHLTVEVLKNLSGTFMEGSPITGRGRVPSGAKIQVGETLIEVTIDAAKESCRLDVAVHHLAKFVYEYVEKTKPATPF